MEFGILGPLEIREADRVRPLTGSKQRALLALLLIHANELWSTEPPGSGSTALQVRVSQLRKTLGAGGRHVVTQAPGYVLRIGREQLDLYRFEQLVAEAEGAEPAVASSKLREALVLWRGPALAEFTFEAFAQAAIGRLEELRLAALERRIEADLALGRHAELTGELEALVVEHPLRERFRAQLILALYRSGRQAEALEAYRTLRQTLVEELGIEPSSALQELEREILRHDPSLDLAQPVMVGHSILVVPLDERHLDALLGLAEPLISHPPRELIIALMIAAADLGRATAHLHERRAGLLANGHSVRTAAFTSGVPGDDINRLATEQDVDLVLLDAGPGLLENDVVRTVLRGRFATSPFSPLATRRLHGGRCSSRLREPSMIGRRSSSARGSHTIRTFRCAWPGRSKKDATRADSLPEPPSRSSARSG